MKPMFHALSGLLLLLPAAAAHAKPADESAGILEHLINNPSPGAMRVEGLREPPPVRSDSGVQGGKALIIAVPGLSKDVWSVPAKSPTTGTVEAGDELVFAVWARLVKSDGAKVADVPYAALQETSEPWTAVVKGGGVPLARIGSCTASPARRQSITRPATLPYRCIWPPESTASRSGRPSF